MARHFHKELEKIKKMILSLGAMVEERVRRIAKVVAELNAEQKAAVEKTMRTLLDPFRKEDADEAMQIVRANGGMDHVNIAFYRHPNDNGTSDKVQWHFWRLEGPGFVWNFRPLPHVHCFVNILEA